MAKTTQTQVSKPATRATRATLAQAPKVHDKPAPQVAEATASPLGVAYRLNDAVRPRSGERLFAHTIAFFTLSGAFDGKSMPKLSEVCGSSFPHHKAAGRIATAGDGYPKLTDEGIRYFTARGVNADLKASYIKALQTGEIPEGLSKLPMIKI